MGQVNFINLYTKYFLNYRSNLYYSQGKREKGDRPRERERRKEQNRKGRETN